MYRLSRGTAIRVKRSTARSENSGVGAKVRRFYASEGGGLRYFVLAEDATTSKPWVWAKYGLYDIDTGLIGIDPDAEGLFKLYHAEYELSSPIYAKAGYKGKYTTDDYGNSMFLTGLCIAGCQAEGSINLDLPDGIVDEEYVHTVTGDTISEIDVVDLPDGLTFNAETSEITGTPTTEGVFQVVLRATAGNGCPITNIQEVTITTS